MRISLRRHGLLLRAAIPSAAFALYLCTAYPEPGWIDSGILAACSWLLDVPHPTAKQLYVLLSRTSVALLPGTFWPLTLLSALAVGTALWAFNSITFSGDRRVQRWSGATAVAALATAPLVWEQATINEVHGLQFLLFVLFMYFWSAAKGPSRLPMLFYLASLAFTNHGTAIFLAPFLIESLWRERHRLRGWIAAAGLSLLGLSPYLYFPIRSSAGALVDWGGTAHWGGFVRHVTGWQFSVWLGAGDMHRFGERLELFGRHLWDNFPWVLFPLSLYGLWVSWRRAPRMAVTALADFLTCALLSAGYSIADIEPYYLLAILLLGLWIGIGLAGLLGDTGCSGTPPWPALSPPSESTRHRASNAWTSAIFTWPPTGSATPWKPSNLGTSC